MYCTTGMSALGQKRTSKSLRGPLLGRSAFDRNLCRIPSIAEIVPFSCLVGLLKFIVHFERYLMLTAKRLRKVLSYASSTGVFRWKVSVSSRALIGAIAGAKNRRGYRQIRIGGRPYSASRLAWLYMTGKWPNSEISYVNGKPSDTRWANLRQAASSQNRNRPKRK
jgi:hypothetical protein